MENALVSVVMPVYNIEKYLSEAVESILRQTYPHWELILVDDGSKDKSGKICDAFATRDERIHVIHQENHGASAARNAGVTAAKGKYLFFVDGDDFLVDDAMEVLLQRAEETDADCIFFLSRLFEDETGKTRAFTAYRQEDFAEGQTGPETLRNLLQGCTYETIPWGYLIRKDGPKDLNLRFYDGLLLEDELFTLQFLLQCDKISFLDRVCYFHREWQGSTMCTGEGNPRRVRSLVIILEEFLNLYELYREDETKKDCLDVRTEDDFLRLLALYYECGFLEQCKVGASMKHLTRRIRSLDREWCRKPEIVQGCRRYRQVALKVDLHNLLKKNV